MTRKEVIHEIADDGVGFVSQLCHHPADKRAAARMPFEINRSVNIPGTVYFRPTMRTIRLLMPDLDKPKFFLQLRIVHDLVP